MGYTTDFTGVFTFSRPLTDLETKYINQFSEIRHMRRNVALLPYGPHLLHDQVGLPIGEEGCFYVDTSGPFGQAHTRDILDYNQEPADCPGLWCQWVVGVNQDTLEWNGMEKFYCYTEWLQWLIDKIFTRWGVTLSGDVEWEGEDSEDIGIIRVRESKIEVIRGETLATLKKKASDKAKLEELSRLCERLGYQKALQDNRKAIELGQMILEGRMEALAPSGNRKARVNPVFDDTGEIAGFHIQILPA